MIFRLRPHFVIQPRDGFDVVIQNFRPLIENQLQGIPVAAEIGDEDFDVRAWRLRANLADRFRPHFGAAVFQFVTIDTGDDDMAKLHRCNGMADAPWLIQIECRRPARRDVAKTAASRADIAKNHQRCGARRPAFAHVGAFGALANRVKPLLVHELQQPAISLAAGHFHFQPGRLASHRQRFGQYQIDSEINP